MTRWIHILGCGLLVAAELLMPASVSAQTESSGPQVLLDTSLGEIRMELRPDAAPVTVENFLRHVDAGFYDGLIFHRVVRDFVIQAGSIEPDLSKRDPLFEPIENEADNGLQNQRGAVAMARYLNPDSATSEFFINTVDNPTLNHTGTSSSRTWGYAVFGHVVDGMEVVDRIRMQATEAQEPFQYLPVEPVVINSIRRLEQP